jgi:parallel beta helix pectate lyase-like protein
MRKLLLSFVAIAAAFVCFVQAQPASAQASRTWISGVGDDVNPCSRTAPCKTFAGAISKTAMFGEIDCLDPGGFGAVTITKSITLDCTGTFGSILYAGSNGIVINFDAFGAGDTQKNAFNSGIIGVRIIGANTASSAVFIENLVIDGNFNGTARGISDERTGGGELYVTNTTVRNNGATGIAVVAASGATAINASINNVRVQNSSFGLAVGPGQQVMVRDSVFSGNTQGGVEADAGGTLNIDNSVISGNGTGISVQGTVRISNSDIMFNAAQASGTVLSYTNNRFVNNGAGGTITAIGSTSNPTGQQ